MRVIVGGIGYRDLRDHSAGVIVSDRLMHEGIGPDIVVEDASYNAVAFAQRLQDEPRDRPFERAIFIGAPPRGGTRAPGSIAAYRWDGALPDAERIQRAVADAVTGIIDADNTLIVCRQLAALPDDVVVIEIEPLEHAFGDALSPAVADAVERACRLVRGCALPGGTDPLPILPLGGAAADVRVP